MILHGDSIHAGMVTYNMGLMGWVGLIVGLIVLAYAGSLVGGWLLPSRSVATTMIRNELRRLHLTQISEPCIAELADFMVKTIEFEISVGTKKGPVNSLLEDEAKSIGLWVDCIVMGDDSYSAAKISAGAANDTPDPVWAVLAKHQPEFFSLEHLDKTQVVNSLRRKMYYDQLAEDHGR
jgi:hypothetical protein